jgi:uncharacterized membrane protein YdjX (TVP38/TMEM64 family)
MQSETVNSNPADPTPVPVSRRLPLARIALGIAALAGFVVLGRFLGGYVDVFRDWIAGLGALGPLVFMLGYALGVVAFLPGAALTLAGGTVFGVAQGTAYVWLAAVVGSSAAFLIARYGARGAVERRLAGNARFAAVDRAVGAEGGKIAFLLRLSPAIPFNVLNYALGLTRIRFVDSLWAAFGMLPGTLLYVYLGSVAGDVASAAAGGGATLQENLVKGIGLLATIAVTVYVTRIARRALREAAGSSLAGESE